MPTSQTQFKAGEVIFRTGDPGTTMYVVRSGEIELRLGDLVVETVAADGIFGEMSLVDKSPRSATAVARIDSELKPIDEKQFLFMVQETPLFAIRVLRTLANRLRVMNQVAV